MVPLDYGTWFVSAALAAIGVPLILVADRLSRRIQSRTGRILMICPIGGIGFLLLGATAAFIIAKIIGPIALAIWGPASASEVSSDKGALIPLMFWAGQAKFQLSWMTESQPLSHVTEPLAF